MSSYPPPPPPPPPLPTPQPDLLNKILVISAIGAGIGFGTCSLGALSGGFAHGVGQAIISGGAILFFVSLASILITGLIMLVRSIMRSSRR
jgi:hypothetical protein